MTSKCSMRSVLELVQACDETTARPHLQMVDAGLLLSISLTSRYLMQAMAALQPNNVAQPHLQVSWDCQMQ